MNKIATLPNASPIVSKNSPFDDKQLQVLKNSLCKDLDMNEFEIFIMACNKTRLDPFMRQIHAVKRDTKKADGSYAKVMTIQTGIDGYRLIADRTGKYAPGRAPTFEYDSSGKLLSSTAYVKKQTSDGTWHEVAATAFFEEYCQFYVDKRSGEKRPTKFWEEKSHGQLAKCAEALALRKAFPAEMSGVYTKEEMEQADVKIEPLSLDMINNLQMVLDDCDPDYKNWILKGLSQKYNIHNIEDISLEIYNKIYPLCVKNMEESRTKQINATEQLLIAEVQ